jgi:C4-dicarboxylate-specific signal transduction histidine kinase
MWTKLKSPNNIVAPAEILAKEYESIDPAESNKYLKIYINALASFYNTDKQLAQVRLNQERFENELQSRDADNRNKISMIVAAAIVILLGGFSFLLWRNNRFKQKANQKLEASYKELKSTQAQLIQSEKMAFSGELTAGIAHEIQNPLNFVNNFSEVNAELLQEIKQGIKAGNYPEVNQLAEDLESNMEKISHHGKRADAIVKSMLQHSRTSTNQKEPTDINELADEYLRLSYHGIRAKDKSFNATLQTEFDPLIGELNIIPQDIGRVLLNIYNNAFYAVAQKKREQLKAMSQKYR